MTIIHPGAIVHPNAKIGSDVEIGAFTTICEDVEIGDGSIIKQGAILDEGTRLGKNCKVGQYSILANPPQDLKYANEKTTLEVGDNTTIREFCTLNRGTTYHNKTRIGANCFIMAYAHVAHDCIVGNNVILANAVTLAGHVTVEDFASIGGLVGVHQFVHIGKYAFIGGGVKVLKDVPPYIRAMGEPLRFGGTNYIGLSRKGMSNEVILEIKRAYKLLFRSNFDVSSALKQIEETLEPIPQITEIINFVKKSERGLIRG